MTTLEKRKSWRGNNPKTKGQSNPFSSVYICAKSEVVVRRTLEFIRTYSSSPDVSRAFAISTGGGREKSRVSPRQDFKMIYFSCLVSELG